MEDYTPTFGDHFETGLAILLGVLVVLVLGFLVGLLAYITGGASLWAVPVAFPGFPLVFAGFQVWRAKR
ncbi:hypothetical protein [Labrys neptuniae]